ncbi:response regulator transcription factor [Enterococcus sp. MMGLQ5-2]|nr:response regulator transcription factor [Enterococcus sp. MMGLQ5-2]MBS7583781.1 response regulator transcription factor [Enterococcus sp. MMGLQ5-1]NPD11642.1 response regulator transcription factor [Enterococcus sp. MMGLQ5-1]NPD36569.1 response regulator transcription factor [Enterococcus sp. MMGLQ5-2]
MKLKRILIIEDDNKIVGLLIKIFEQWQFEAKGIEEFNQILSEFNLYQPDLVLMDIKLPFNNGFYWTQEIRKSSTVPIIFISSSDDHMNMVMAMNLGADDYIAKPFDSEVLVAKIQALLRRTYQFPIADSHILNIGEVALNTETGELSNGDLKVGLSKNETMILKALIQQAGHVVTNNTLIEKLWEGGDFVDSNILAVNISRLRKKAAAVQMKPIENKKGKGYFIES